MGTDIHCYAEVRDAVTGLWLKVGSVFDDPAFRPDEPADRVVCYVRLAEPRAERREVRDWQTGALTVVVDTVENLFVGQDDPLSHGARGLPHDFDEECVVWNQRHTDHPYVGRNYDLFAILADVRNGSGFAGIVTGDGFETLPGAPRGIPTDLSAALAVEYERAREWTHDPTWATLRELLDYPWHTKTTTKCGVVTLEAFKAHRKTGVPYDGWSGMVSGEGIVVMEAGVFSGVDLDQYRAEQGFRVHVRDYWQTTYAETVGPHWFAVLETLKALGEPDDVRIVCWFDS